MSVIARNAVEKNLEQIEKQLQSTESTDNDIIKKLNSRLSKETDPDIRVLISEKITRLEKAKKEPSKYAEYKTELMNLQKLLQQVLTIMGTVPWYVEASRGKSAATSKKVVRRKK